MARATRVGVKPLTDETFQLLQGLIYRETGIHMRDTKRILVSNRLRKRVTALGLESFDQYYRHITSMNGGKEEIPHFINAVSTNETYFYRGDTHFEMLKNVVLPDLCKRKKAIRIWSAGCSSGEEPYTVCIVILEEADPACQGAIEIVATDINSKVIEAAKRGIYGGRTLQYVRPDLIEKYFSAHENGKYQVKETVRRRVRFAVHNLLKDDPPGSGFDMIFCRNVMIYFDKSTQRKLVDGSFARALAPDGYLFIGHSESLIGCSELFRYARLKAPIYRPIAREA
jgi:chemotaxis protein methyltransferase CheR